MNFAIPRKNNTEMLLYIWKIIDLPSISLSDLLYKISFELFLLSPTKASDFIENCIENENLLKDENQNLRLSNALSQKLITWQTARKGVILEKITSAKKVAKLKSDINKKEPTNFSVLINAFTDKGTLNRSVSISDAAFEILEYDHDKGMIKSKVAGSKKEPYIIEIDTNEKILRHNCHDFEERRASNKKFCKHLTKLFLLLKEKDENIAEFFLKKLAENIDVWDFST
jgi:hypothetical protein